MPTFDNSYSRVVAWLKIAFPLLALAILSTLFWVSRPVKPVADLGDAETTAANEGAQKIDDLLYTGLTPNGAAVTLRAGKATTLIDASQDVELRNINGRIEFDAGNYINLVATDGILDGASSSGFLRSGVVISTSSGYRMETNSLLAELTIGRIFAKTEVIGTGPLGDIKAGSMVMQQQSGIGLGNAFELVFKNGVRLLYDPNKNRK